MEKCTINPNECIGCTACAHSCPTEAIKIQKNTEGFLSAVINDEACIKCGICFNVCPVQQGSNAGEEYKEAYACYSKNKDIQNTSTSGGIFYFIAKEILKKDGTVYGATMDENLVVKHIPIQKEEDLHKLQGSKYVQSELGDTYAEIKDRLENDEYILFSGTGCQVTGLKQYLKKDYEKLLTVDLICHGIPSPGMFEDYTAYLGKKYGGKVIAYKFRQKNPKEAQSYDTKIEIQKGAKVIEKTISGDDDPFTLNYLQNTLQNKECYKCKFASLKRLSDITLGDYWGIGEAHPDFSKGNSVSLVLLQTEKALSVWENIKSELEFLPTDKEKILKRNRQLAEPAPYNARRTDVYGNYAKGRFGHKFYFKHFLGKNMAIYLLKRKILEILK
ncbi:MAG: Coenzyme F420 hydrogenase/dehydrogenase, beta subunit C-terminal domain [Clostridia bacterium]|nr:Coenzyme F420 hydrogenase/dehydrogenase, beta subunit C-terminal domain [Clostridia bacterium]